MLTKFGTTRAVLRVVLFTLSLTGAAAAQTAEEIVKKMDENMTFTTRTGEATLEVLRAGEAPDTRKLKIQARGFDDS